MDIFGNSDIVASFKKSWQLTSTGLEGVKSGTGKEEAGEWRPRKPEQPPGERPLPTHGL